MAGGVWNRWECNLTYVTASNEQHATIQVVRFVRVLSSISTIAQEAIKISIYTTKFLLFTLRLYL